jgi:hypothetical protein
MHIFEEIKFEQVIVLRIVRAIELRALIIWFITWTIADHSSPARQPSPAELMGFSLFALGLVYAVDALVLRPWHKWVVDRRRSTAAEKISPTRCKT